MELTPQEVQRLHCQAIMVEHAPHWHAIVEGPLVEHDDGTKGRMHAEIRAFAATRDEAQVEVMAGLVDTCEGLEIDFSPDEWTLLDMHMHGGN